MQITIEMIETKEFKTKPRGYDPQEVDEFLDAICDEMARQMDEIAALQQQLAAAKAARPVVEAPTQQLKPIAPVAPKAVPDAEASARIEQLLRGPRVQERFKEYIAGLPFKGVPE